MAVENSVSVTVSAGLNTIQLPSDNLTIVGLYPFSVYVGILLSPGEFAYPPQPVPSVNPQHLFIKTHYKMSTSQLIVNSSGAGNLTVYFGSPLPNSIPLESFKGVLTVVAFAAAGATSQNVTVNMPKSNGTLVGFSVYEAQSGYEYDLSWSNSTGKTMTFYATYGQIATAEDIVPLNVPNVANSFTVAVNTSSTTASNTVTFILYYK